jgi:hypothetical protein
MKNKIKELIKKYEEMIQLIIDDEVMSEQTKSSTVCLLRMTVISDLEKIIGIDK